MTKGDRSTMLFLGLTVAIGAWPELAGAQAIHCGVRRRADGSYLGACARGDTAVAQLSLRHPADSEPYLWRGSAAFADGPREIAIDVRRGGALRLGRQWLASTGVRADSSALEFDFSTEKPSPANQVDVEILRRARVYLSDSAHWNPADSTDMGLAPSQGFHCPPTVARSMFCALYVSSRDVAGDYAQRTDHEVDRCTKGPRCSPEADTRLPTRRWHITSLQLVAARQTTLVESSPWRPMVPKTHLAVAGQLPPPREPQPLDMI